MTQECKEIVILLIKDRIAVCEQRKEMFSGWIDKDNPDGNYLSLWRKEADTIKILNTHLKEINEEVPGNGSVQKHSHLSKVAVS